MSHSTSGTGPGGGERQVRQFDPVGPSTRGAEPVTEPAGPGGPSSSRTTAGGRRRPPVWLLALVGVLVVGLVVVVVLVLNRGSAPEPEVLEAEVVTLAPPTPTIEPIAREAGSALFESLPSTVLGYALTEAGTHPPLITAGALEAYRMVYSDGGATTVALVVGQWATPEAAVTAYQATVAAQTAEAAAAGTGDAGEGEGDAGEGGEAAVTDVEEGPVLVDGTEVGRYTLVPRPDGSGTLTWTNGTVMLDVAGPAAALRDFHTAYTL